MVANSMSEIVITRRCTTPFLAAVPPQVEHFDAHVYAIVKRKPGKDLPNEKYGTDVRLDPCLLDWTTRCITIHIPLNINTGIESVDDLDPAFFEAVEAAFLAIIQSCMP